MDVEYKANDTVAPEEIQSFLTRFLRPQRLIWLPGQVNVDNKSAVFCSVTLTPLVM